MKHLQQPKGSLLCGQVCVAMLADVGLVEAVIATGHGKATGTNELRAALRELGRRCGRERWAEEFADLPRRGRFLAKFWRRGLRKSHTVVYAGRRVFDPHRPGPMTRAAFEKRLRENEYVPVSYVEVQGKGGGRA